MHDTEKSPGKRHSGLDPYNVEHFTGVKWQTELTRDKTYFVAARVAFFPWLFFHSSNFGLFAKLFPEISDLLAEKTVDAALGKKKI